MNPRVLLDGTKVVEQPAALESLTQRYPSTPFSLSTNLPGLRSSYTLPHTSAYPLAASNRFRGKSLQGLYDDLVEQLDWSVGEELQELKRNDLEQDTPVFFSSDNGR